MNPEPKELTNVVSFEEKIACNYCKCYVGFFSHYMIYPDNVEGVRFCLNEKSPCYNLRNFPNRDNSREELFKGCEQIDPKINYIAPHIVKEMAKDSFLLNKLGINLENGKTAAELNSEHKESKKKLETNWIFQGY